MARGLDHVVLAVRDLDIAAAAWSRLGFQVGPENRHPFGTVNRVIQLPGFFIELLAIADRTAIAEHGPRRFSFAAFNRDRLAAAGEGLTMLALEGADAEEDAAAFRETGLGDFEPFAFARQGTAPDGGPADLSFRLAFARAPGADEIGFFTCQQLAPGAFWNPALQRHANGAEGIAGVVMTAEYPTDHHIFLSAFTGVRVMKATSSGIRIETPRGEIEVLTPPAFANRFGEEAGLAPRLRVLRFRVAAIENTAALLATAGVAAERRGTALVVRATGAAIAFEPA